MKSTSLSKIILPLVTICALLIMVAWMAGAFSPKMKPGLTLTPTVNNVDIALVLKQSLPVIEPVPATIQAKQTSILSSRILARIKTILVRAGDHVEKDQLLIKLEQSDLKSKVSQAKANINAVEARLIEAQKTLNRSKELIKKGVISQAALDSAHANVDSLNANFNTAKQALNEANTTLQFADIRSPISGRIVDRFSEPGDIAQPGQQLLSLYDPQSMRVEAHVREKLALSLTLHQKLNVQVPAINQTLDTEIEERVPAGNPGSRSFLIKSRIHAQNTLLPGMYARLMIPTENESILTIPENRVAHIGQLDIVWVIKNKKVERRYIRTGKKLANDQVEVVSGLAEGERLITPPSIK